MTGKKVVADNFVIFWKTVLHGIKFYLLFTISLLLSLITMIPMVILWLPTLGWSWEIYMRIIEWAFSWDDEKLE